MASWLLDLDGVVWLGDRPIAGAAAAVARLRARGERVGFCTNNSAATHDEYVAKLARHGLLPDAAGDPVGDDVLTSARAVGALVEPGERVLVCGDAGVVEAVTRRGALPVHDGPADAVVVGFHRSFDYARMTAATRAVLGGARLLATNDDPIYPGADGPAPGNGAILASIERATGRRAEIAGKPHEPMAALARRWAGEDGAAVVIGDSPATDGALAARLGWPFGLVLSGNTHRRDGVEATWVASDLAELVDVIGPGAVPRLDPTSPAPRPHPGSGTPQ